MKKTLAIFFIYFSFALSTSIFAHPTGDMIAVGNHILWSYVSPVDDPDHHACVMIWSEGTKPKVLIRSAFQASDYMLYNRGDIVYIIERKYSQAGESFQSRVLKMKTGEKPREIWEWFEDEWHVGEGGFYMPSDKQIFFAHYPNIYSMEMGKSPIKSHFKTPQPVNSLRPVENDQFLLLSENSCRLVNEKGAILKIWDKLLYEEISDAPLNRNQVFDVDYQNGELLMAYWGNRSFDVITSNGERKSLLKQKKPLTPHWVCYFKDKVLLFSSRLVFDGSNPSPKLILYKPNQEKVKIWEE